jgi:hypothetical protein
MYNVKYRIELSDLRAVKWKVDILEDDFAGDITALIASGDPLVFYKDNNSDDVFDTVHETHVDICVWSTANFNLQSLYTDDLLKYKVNIYADDVLRFSGWIEPQMYSEAYEPPPYPVTISATCGLSELEMITYDDDGTYYNGRRYESQIYLDILGKIGFTEFKEYVNIYENIMSSDADDSPLDQTLINVDIFKDYNCLEVLNELLKKSHAVIVQDAGMFNIIRPAELTATTVYGRYFTAYDTKTGITLTPDQYIRRTGIASNYRQVPGGTLMIEPPLEDVRYYQDYGNRESWIDNHKFEAETVDSTAGTVDQWEWENTNYKDFYHISEILTSEKEGIGLGSTNPYQVVYLKQEFGDSIASSTDQFTISFEYGWYNNTGSSNNSVTNIYVEIKCGSYYLVEKDDNTCEWTLTPSAILIFPLDALGTTTVESGFTGWYKYSRTFTDIPSTTTLNKLIVRVAGNLIGDCYNCIKDLQFYVSSHAVFKKITKGLKAVRQLRPNRQSVYTTRKMNYEEVTKVEREYSATNAISGGKHDDDFLLGDVTDTELTNILGQFQGSLAVLFSGVLLPTATWNTRGGAEADQLLQIICDERASMYSRSKQFIQMPIYETAKTGMNFLGNIIDTVNTRESHARVFFISRGEYHVRQRKWQADLFEIGVRNISEIEGSITADSTLITADNGIITSDTI